MPGWIANWARILVLSLLAAGARGQEPTAKPAPNIRVQRVDSASVVVREITGPYWNVRRRLADVVAYMTEHGASGTLFIRYGSDPTGPDAPALLSQVGFVDVGNHDAEPPFRRVKRPAETVVSMTIDFPGAASHRNFRMLRQWSVANGHELAGPVIELFPKGFDARADGRSGQRIELQMVIERHGSADHSAGQLEPAAAEEESMRSEFRPKSTVEEAKVAKIEVPVTQAVVSSPSAPLSDRPKEEPFVDDGGMTIAELIEDGHSVAAARRLLPRGDTLRPELDLWIGQVVFRVSAAAKGIDRMYPGEAGDFQSFAVVLKAEYRLASKQRASNGIDQKVVRVDPGQARSSKLQRALVLDLDRLLAQISVQAVSPSEALVELSRVLTEVGDVVRMSPDRALSATSPED